MGPHPTPHPLPLYDLPTSSVEQSSPEPIDARIEALILAIRDDPPEGLRRTSGPKAILYYLPRQVTIWESGLRLPTSTRTIYHILKRNQRIAHRAPRPVPPDLPRLYYDSDEIGCAPGKVKVGDRLSK